MKQTVANDALRTLPIRRSPQLPPFHPADPAQQQVVQEALHAGTDAGGDEGCKSCHKAIHDLIPNEKELGKRYNTREKLLAHPQIAGYVKWKREQGQKAKSQEVSHAQMPNLRSK